MKYFVIGFFLFVINFSNAQVNVNVNIGASPAWGPAGYNDVRYYYLPDLDTYYDVNTSNYIYSSNGKWLRARTLSSAYRNYDLYNEIQSCTD